MGDIDRSGDAAQPSTSLLLDLRQRKTFVWLLLGHLLYVAGLFVMVQQDSLLGNIWITPLFAVPLLLFGPKDRFWARLLVFVVGMTAAHYAAMDVTIQLSAGTLPFIPGAVGGLIGGLTTLVLCVAFRLTVPGDEARNWTVIGTLLLTAAGSVGVYCYILSMTSKGIAAGGLISDALQMLWIYTPWQLVLAYVLAKILK